MRYFRRVKKATYFISDVHLGAPNAEESRARERKLLRFLQSIAHDCAHLYIVGDLFDFWFEYKHVVPRGHVRLLGTLAQMVENGMKLDVFVGNHDLWLGDYLSQELGATMHYAPLEVELDGRQFYIARGDGLGPGDRKYKALKKLFTNPVAIWLYQRFHPNFGVGFAAAMSKKSRNSQDENDHAFLGDKERQLIHSQHILKTSSIDYFIYGHRHHLKNLPLVHTAPGGEVRTARYVVLGDWIRYNSFARWDGRDFQLGQVDASGEHIRWVEGE